jgi:hypothetical protein
MHGEASVRRGSRLGAITAVTLTTLAVPAQAAARQAAPPTPPTVRMTATVQLQYNTTSVTESQAGVSTPIAPSTFEMRRVRMGLEMRLADGLTARVEPEFAMGRVALRNAWMELGVADGWSVRAGQFKKPFGLIQLASNTVVPTIERAARIRGLPAAHARADNAAGGQLVSRLRGRVLLPDHHDLLDGLGLHGYDIGAAVYGEIGALRLQAGLFNGSGADQLDETGRKSVAARATYGLPTARPVRVGVGTSYRELAGAQAAGGAFEVIGGWAHNVEVEVGGFRRPGPNLMAEAVTGDNFAAGTRFRAAHAIGSWYGALAPGRRVEGVEGVARLGWGDPRTDVGGDDALLVTPGINVYMSGRNRLMLNWDLFLPAGDAFPRHNAVRVQAQVYH